MKKMMDLAKVMANRKIQLTDWKSNWHKDTNIKAGREKLPTNVPSPLASTSLMKLNLPAANPRKMMPKH